MPIQHLCWLLLSLSKCLRVSRHPSTTLILTDAERCRGRSPGLPWAPGSPLPLLQSSLLAPSWPGGAGSPGRPGQPAGLSVGPRAPAGRAAALLAGALAPVSAPHARGWPKTQRNAQLTLPIKEARMWPAVVQCYLKLGHGISFFSTQLRVKLKLNRSDFYES